MPVLHIPRVHRERLKVVFNDFQGLIYLLNVARGLGECLSSHYETEHQTGFGVHGSKMWQLFG